METLISCIKEVSAKSKPPLLDKQKWINLIREWENSNESQKVFCKRLQLNLHSFSYVRGQLLSKQKPTEAKFIAVKIKEETKVAPQADFLVIENGNGIKINLPLGISEAKIFHLLKIIGWHHA